MKENFKVKLMTRTFLLIILSIIYIVAYGNDSPFKCTLKGVVKDRSESINLILTKEDANLRSEQWILIPIDNGTFEYTFNCDHNEIYQLVFHDEYTNNAYKPIKFISEEGVINFILHPFNKFDMNTVQGNQLNKEFYNFLFEDKEIAISFRNIQTAKIDKLHKDKKFYTEDAQLLLYKIDTATNTSEKEKLSEQFQNLKIKGIDLTPDAKKILSNDSLYVMLLNRRLQYAKDHTNIFGYSLLLNSVKTIIEGFDFDILPFMNLYSSVYHSKFSSHPITIKLENIIRGSTLNTGSTFTDFTAVDIMGKQVKLSELVKGKPSILHLWSSWCGPCRENGIKLIPIYERFKDKGFVVVGVARERNITNFETAIKIDKYPWKNLIILNDVQGVWDTYGLKRTAGGEFLIDEKGNIVAINPSSEEIRTYLEKYYEIQ